MMMYGIHNHTTFCDGINTPEEMLREAVSLGFFAFGFSSHSDTFFDKTQISITKDTIKAYINEINRLKNEYGDRIKVLCGIEQDYYSPLYNENYDYIIGSIHYLKKDNDYICVDYTKDALLSGIQKHFKGDKYEFAKEYFELYSTVVKKTGCNIIGHFDIINKFKIFDESDLKYQSLALGAIDEILKNKNVVFEINSAPFFKDKNNYPYPAPFIMDKLKKENQKCVLSGDNHSTKFLKESFIASMEYANKWNMESFSP